MKRTFSIIVVQLILVLIPVYGVIQQLRNEVFAMAGTAGTDVENIREYMNEDKESLIHDGKTVFSDAGYGYSADVHITSSALKGCMPYFVVFAVSEIVAGIGTYLSCRKENREKIQLEMENDRLRSENGRLNIQMTRMSEGMGRYEENLYHQLKTPLTGLQLCLEQMEGNEDVLSAAHMETDKITRLVTLLLKERQLNAGKVRFSFELCDVIHLLHEACESLQPQIKQKKCETDYEIDESNLEISCDETWLRECFVTLMENAVEHGKGKVRIILKRQDNRCLIRFVSIGTSLNEKEIPLLFERFHSTSSGHFGIGLHMAKMIVENHHGRIRAYNSEGNAVFEIRLPILNGAQAYIQ